MVLLYPILWILMANRSRGRNGNELKEQLWSHEERRSGSSTRVAITPHVDRLPWVSMIVNVDQDEPGYSALSETCGYTWSSTWWWVLLLYVDNCLESLMSSFPEGRRWGSCCPNVENACPTVQRTLSTILTWTWALLGARMPVLEENLCEPQKN
jgi:hypothetical protein